jgi:hypothetical protein
VRGTLRARSSCINVEVTGNFRTAIVSNSPALVDVRNANSAGDGFFLACGTAALDGRDINADADGDQSPPYLPAGDILVACSGSISGTGGPFHAKATGGDDGGFIELTSTGGSVDLASAFDVNGGGIGSFGGQIIVTAAVDLAVGTTGRSLDAQGSQGGPGGSVDLFAGGTASINGSINVDGNGDGSDAGSIAVSASQVMTGSTWNARGAQAGWGGSISIEAFGANGSGTIVTTSGTNSFNTIGGDGGGLGGEITLDAAGSITLAGDMDTTGQGDFSSPGGITILGGFGPGNTITIQGSSRLKAIGVGPDAINGVIDISACNIVLEGVLDTRVPGLVEGGGTNFLTYYGQLMSSVGSALFADDPIDLGRNSITCRCVDTSPADGTCDTPASCVSPPILNGTVTPMQTITYRATSGCA